MRGRLSGKADKEVNPLLTHECWSVALLHPVNCQGPGAATHLFCCHLPKSRLFEIAAANPI